MTILALQFFSRISVCYGVSMRFQKRDGYILQAIYINDGVVAKRHLKELFWPDKTWRAMELRLSKLREKAYIDWPNREHYKKNPIPEPVCWLGLQGADYITGLYGVEMGIPKRGTETQLRSFQKDLRKHGIRWVREPRWSLLRHDIAIVDFRLAVEKAVSELRSLSLEKWFPESEFRSTTDVISYKTRSRNGYWKNKRKGVVPDAYFEIVDETRRNKGELHRARFLLELDMSTHDNLRFGREKVLPGVAYIKSKEFKARFGDNNGYWLVVTNGGERRLRNLMDQTKNKTGCSSRLFFFTSLDHLDEDNLLTSPIWRQADRDDQRSLFYLS